MILASTVVTAAHAQAISWTNTPVEILQPVDDDIGRHAGDARYFHGIDISEVRFTENGFAWHVIRFTNAAKPVGPLWVTPHDDENAAFEAMIAAIREHGGSGLAVNSGPGSSRNQSGEGRCGVVARKVASCDPNRNFGAATPIFTAVFLGQHIKDQPVIALHTNGLGFAADGSEGRGNITMLDRAAYRRGIFAPRSGGLFAVQPQMVMANYDSFGITAFLAKNGGPSAEAARCGRALADAGIHFWHEPVSKSDGSMSNYLVVHQPEIRYFNAESRHESSLDVAAARHRIMAAAYLSNCVPSGNQPAP